MARILKWGAAGLAALILIAGTAWLFLDIKSLVADRTAAATSRKFAIEGDIHIDWSAAPLITLNGVVLGNADWGSQPTMAQIEQVSFRLRLWDLLRGRVVLPEITLIRPALLLEISPNGERANWEFNPAAQAVKPEERGEFPLIGRLIIEAGQVTYRDHQRGIDIQSEVATAIGSGGRGHDMIELIGEGRFEQEPFRLEIKAGSLLALRDRDQPYPLTADIRVGDTHGILDGTMAEPLRLEGVKARLLLEGADASHLFPVVGLPIPQTPPYRIEGVLRRTDNTWSFSDFRGTVGDSDLAGSLDYVIRDPRPFVRAELFSNRLDFDDLAPLIGGTPATGQGDTSSAEQRRTAAQRAASPRVIPDARLNLERLGAVDANVRFRGRRIDAPNLPLDNLNAHLVLEDRRLTFQPLNFGVAQGKVVSNITLNGRGKSPSTAADIQILQVKLKSLFAGTRFARESDGLIAGRARFRGEGNSVHEVLGTADGDLTILMEQGRLSGLLIEAAGLDVAEGLSFLLTKDQAIGIRCLVADFKVENGVMTPKILVLDTTDTNVTAGGQIDLGKETLKLKIVPQPKDSTALSARTPVRIEGTFKAPEVDVEKAPLVARAAAAVALGALLTPFAAVLPFLDVGLGENSDCRGMIKLAKEDGSAPKTDQERR